MPVSVSVSVCHDGTKGASRAARKIKEKHPRAERNLKKKPVLVY